MDGAGDKTQGDAKTAVATQAATPLPPPRSAPRPAADTTVATAAIQPARDASAMARDSLPLGVVGPLAWPGAYEDVVGFTLWPQKYGERLRTHGIADVLNTLFKPAVLASQTRAELARGAPGKPDAGAPDTKSLCVDVEASPDWPTAQIGQSAKLTAEQQSALDEFHRAVGDAVASIKATCRDEAAMLPMDRIRALQNVLWTVRDAAILIRAPLAKFFDSLTDEQKKTFMLSGQQPDLRAMAMNAQGAARDEIARICGMSKAAEWPSRSIEMFLQPNEAQRASLENVQKKAFEMAQFLLASCLQPIPATPTERLDAAVDRLTAMIFATSNINLALNDFYNQLSEQQKTKINSLKR